MKIAFCTPYGYNMLPEHARRLTMAQSNMLQHQFFHLEVDMNIVSKARQTIVENAPPDVDLLWWVDSDVLLPPNAPELLNYISDDSPVVSGLYVARREPFLPQAYMLASASEDHHPYLPLTNIPEQPTKVDAVGAGCLLMRRTVLEQMLEAHEVQLAAARALLDTVPIPVRRLLRYTLSLNPWFEFLGGVGEDFYFCERLRELLDIRPLLVPSVRCSHVGLRECTVEEFQARANWFEHGGGQ